MLHGDKHRSVSVSESIDANGGGNSFDEEKKTVYHHHFIAHKDYDRTITTKIQSIITNSVSHLKQGGEEEGEQEKEEQEQIAQTRVSNSTISKIKRIMIVDDEKDVTFLFKMVLEDVLTTNAKIKVYPFNDPFIALENFRPNLYDLVLIDIVMADMNGFELYDKIRILDNKVKICFLTAGEMYQEDIRKEAFPELEANCFIRKPIANQDLIKQIKEILELK